MVLMPLLMLLPLLALPIFWFLPLVKALPIYLCLVAVSLSMMLVMRKTMKMPSRTGAEYLVGREAKVVKAPRPGNEGRYLVRTDGELWSAQSNDVLKAGDTVIIMAVKSNALTVKRRIEERK